MAELKDIKVGPVFPPYQLGDFQRCPKLWDYKRRWQAREEGTRTALLVGTAVALGLELYLQGQPKEDALEAARAHVETHYEEDSDRSLETVQTLVRRGVKHGMATELGLSEVLGVEKWYGRVRPDVVGRWSDGSLVVLDHKVKMNLDDKYKEKELLTFDVSNQMQHYAWVVGQEYGEPVKYCLIHLIVLAPRVYTEVHPIAIDQEHLASWLQSAAKDYQEMAAIEAGKFPARQRFASCVDKYGCCDFWTGCHTFNGNEEKFPVLYNKKAARRW